MFEKLFNSFNLSHSSCCCPGAQVLEQSHLIKAITQAGTVQRFIPSEFSVDIPRAQAKLPDLFEPRLQIMQEVKAAEIPYTVITSNGFMNDWNAGRQGQAIQATILEVHELAKSVLAQHMYTQRCCRDWH